MAQVLIYGHGPLLKKLLCAKQNSRLPHALLFTGPSGIGKRKSACALAQSLLCEKPSAEGSACGECPSCLSVEEEKNPHILFIQPEGLQIKVDAVRRVGRFVSLQSFAPARVIIMDSAHQMNLQAGNSILKILEEPPNNVYFILISPTLSALPVTVRSRVQTVRFAPLKPKDLRAVMQQTAEKSTPTEKISEWLIQASRGSMDQVEMWREHAPLISRACALLTETIAVDGGGGFCAFGTLNDLIKKRERALFVCLYYQRIFRDARMAQLTGSAQSFLAEGGDQQSKEQKQLLSLLSKLPFAMLDLFFQQTVKLERELKGYLDSPLAFDNLFAHIREQVQEQCKKPAEGRVS